MEHVKTFCVDSFFFILTVKVAVYQNYVRPDSKQEEIPFGFDSCCGIEILEFSNKKKTVDSFGLFMSELKQFGFECLGCHLITCH